MINSPEILMEVRQHRRVRGFYKVKVMDSYNRVAHETDWKENLILNTGLDKLAHMPWGQVAQFCVCGDKVNPATPAATDWMLQSPYAISMFYLLGSGACGASRSGNVLKIRRTHDFYKFMTNKAITELGWKESPAATTLFSRVVLNPAQRVRAGQFLRIEYELNIELNPQASAAPNPVPTITGWTTSSNDRESLQLIGMAGVDPNTGMVNAFDAGGWCNEIFAPGGRSFGPGFGFVNRWKNGKAVNYNSGTGGTGDPNVDIGPLTPFNAVYQNPHDWLLKVIKDGNAAGFSGTLYVTGAHRNYWDLDFMNAMQAYHQWQLNLGSNEGDGKRQATPTVSSAQLSSPVSGANITHLMQPEAKYEAPSNDQWHALNLYFFDPATTPVDADHASKSYVAFPGEVQQPGVLAPYWDDLLVSGASCFLSTAADALAALGSKVDRATGYNSVELPLRLEPYTPGSFTRTKYCLFDTFIANDTWRTVGIGPTSTSIVPGDMKNAAQNNGYAYLFNVGNQKLNTHQLKIAFTYTWNRV